MARPERKTVDYFPFYVEEGQKMFYIEETYGNDGFAVFLKILRELAKVENHYLDLSKPTQLMFLSAKCKVSKEVLEAIIKDLVNLEKFDTELWNECKVIWCQDFVDSIQDAYRKRNNLCMTKQGLSSLLISLGRKKQSKVQTKGDINTQIKEKKRKEKEIIDFDVLLSYINNTLNRKFKVINKTVQGKFNARLEEGYTKEDIKNCIDNLKNIQYHKDNGYQYCTPEFISRSETLEKYSVKTAQTKISGEDEYMMNVMKQVNANKLL